MADRRKTRRALVNIKCPAPETEAVLASGSLFLFGLALAAVMFVELPASAKEYIMLMLGALIGLVKDTFARYFNVTKGAQEQRKAISDLADAAKTTAAIAAAPVVETVTTRTTTGQDNDTGETSPPAGAADGSAGATGAGRSADVAASAEPPAVPPWA